MRSEFVLELNLVIFLFICKGKERRFLYEHAWSTDLVVSFSAENLLVWLGIGSSASLTPLSLQDKFSAELHVLHFMICLLLCFRIPFLKEGALTFCTVMLFSFIVNAPSWSSACLSLWEDSACSLYPHSFVVNVNNGMSLLIDEYGLESCKLDKCELVVYRSSQCFVRHACVLEDSPPHPTPPLRNAPHVLHLHLRDLSDAWPQEIR